MIKEITIKEITIKMEYEEVEKLFEKIFKTYYADSEMSYMELLEGIERLECENDELRRDIARAENFDLDAMYNYS